MNHIILTPGQVKVFYEASLAYSGFLSLNEETIRVWEKLVPTCGYNPVPPGFPAKLLFILTTVATRLPGKTAFYSDHRETGRIKDTVWHKEDYLIEVIRRSPAFARLEGEFITRGFHPDSEESFKVLEIILEKLNFFYHETYRLFSKHLTTSFSAETKPDNNFPVEDLLENLYENALEYMLTNDTMLEDTDLFEIHHPRLFSGESSSRLRLLYRNMADFQRIIKKRLLSQVTLKTETDTIIQNYAEPQVLMVGGYDSVTTKGNLASLLPSELAYIDETQDFDYFDYKYIQNELLYYSREEGSVFRIRRFFHLELKLTPEMEFDENIALLFAFCLAFAEKTVSVFQKDILKVYIYLHGFKPTSISRALSFFEHFITESSLHSNVFIADFTELSENITNNRHIQHLIIGKTIIGEEKSLDFAFPENEDFFALEAEKKGSLLSGMINNIIEGLVNASYC